MVVTVLVLLSPIFGIPILFAWYLDNESKDLRAQTALEERIMSRPIGPSDTLGFCSVPRWRIVSGYPELSVAVRAPRPGIYRLRTSGFDVSSRTFSASTAVALDAGVETLTVRLRNQDRRDRGGVVWPLRISELEFSGPAGMIDTRYGVSLYVVGRELQGD